MSTPALLKSNYSGTCIQQAHKNNRDWPSYLQCVPFVETILVASALACIHLSQYHGVLIDHILRWHLVEHSLEGTCNRSSQVAMFSSRIIFLSSLQLHTFNCDKSTRLHLPSTAIIRSQRFAPLQLQISVHSYNLQVLEIESKL